MAATGIKKLKRSHLMHLLDSTFGGETPSWFLIGKNIEDMSMDLGPDTATVTNLVCLLKHTTQIQKMRFTKRSNLLRWIVLLATTARANILRCLSIRPKVLTMHGWKIASLSRSHMADRRAVSTYRLISNPAAIVLRVL